MKGKYRLGSAAGISVYLHWSFVLFAGGLFVWFLIQGSALMGALLGLMLFLAVFGLVVLHEYGHALTARYFGIKTEDITLYPIGGVARLQRMPKNPWHELWIALAGPAVNVILAIFFFALIALTGSSFAPVQLLSVAGTSNPLPYILASMLYVNVALVVFNMLPAFPMDGGRVLRSILAINMNYRKATRIASRVGQIMAILFGIGGFLSSNPILIFIAFFVYMGAKQEALMVDLEPNSFAYDSSQVEDSPLPDGNEAKSGSEHVVYHDPVTGRKIIYIDYK